MAVSKYFGATDPGKGGWLVILDENANIVYHEPTPTLGKDYDHRKLANMVSNIAHEYKNIHWVVENVGPSHKFGAIGNFSLGGCKGMLQQVLTDFSIPHTLVLAKTWNKEMWSGVKVVHKPLTPKQKKIGRKKGEVDTKTTSFIAAQRLFPEFDFYITQKKGESKNFNHDLVDSVLMAEYCRRNFK